MNIVIVDNIENTIVSDRLKEVVKIIDTTNTVIRAPEILQSYPLIPKGNRERRRERRKLERLKK